LEHGVPADLVLLEKEARFTVTAAGRRRIRSCSSHGRTSSGARSRSAGNSGRKSSETCAGTDLPLNAYVSVINDVDRVINMIVGDFARLASDADDGIAVAQQPTAHAEAAFQSLRDAGYTQRLSVTQQTQYPEAFA